MRGGIRNTYLISGDRRRVKACIVEPCVIHTSSMFFAANSIDDLLRSTFEALHDYGKPEKATKGSFVELVGVSLKLGNPRARMSRSEEKGRPFSSIGELFWYLSGRNDLSFIEYFLKAYKKSAEKDGTIHGGYGPRIFPKDTSSQFDQIIDRIEKKRSTRQAVIQLFDRTDVAIGTQYKDVPCTCTIQYLCREQRLSCVVSMRSNDAFKGLPHDIFCFTMLQEMLAKRLNLELGEYHHLVGSLHLYESDVTSSRHYLQEGWQSEIAMPEMPSGDNFAMVPTFLSTINAIQSGKGIAGVDPKLDVYWKDLALLLVAYHHSQDPEMIDDVHAAMSHDTYFPFLERRKMVKRPETK